MWKKKCSGGWRRLGQPLDNDAGLILRDKGKLRELARSSGSSQDKGGLLYRQRNPVSDKNGPALTLLSRWWGAFHGKRGLLANLTTDIRTEQIELLVHYSLQLKACEVHSQGCHMGELQTTMLS